MENFINKIKLKYESLLESPLVFQIILFLVFLFALSFAYANRFIQDDAFITFRYSENWVSGVGPVFNSGERVEGYTNFLWMLIITGSLYFFKDPILISYFFGLLFYFITLICYFKISKSFFSKPVFGLILVGLIGSNYSISSYSTGGLETSLASALIAIVFFYLYDIDSYNFDNAKLAILSFFLAMLILTRLDLGILVFVIYSYLIVKIFYTRKNNKFSNFFYLNAPLFLIVFFYLIWKWFFYGNLLPNTFNAKLNGGSDNNLLSGIDYLYTFISTYWLGFPLLLIIFLFLFKKISLESNFEKVGFLVLIIVTFYIVMIGGDFMEFRFFIPYFPLLFLFLLKYLYSFMGSIGVLLLSVSLVTSSMHYRFKDRKSLIKNLSFSGIETISNLKSHLFDPLKNWVFIGKKFADYFKNEKVKIAVGPAGVIPYYSKLECIDMLGLNDINVKNPEYFDTYPAYKSGHKKYSKLSYLQKENVHLVISNPIVFPSKLLYTENPILASLIESQIDININNKYSLIRAFFPLIKGEEIENFKELKFLWIPLDEKTRLLVLYLTESENLNQIIKENEWDSFSINLH